MKDEFSKFLYLTAAIRSIFLTSNVSGNPKSQLSAANLSENIEDTFISSANTILKHISRTKRKVARSKFKKWFNLNCQEMRRDLLSATKSLSKFPKNSFLRGKFFY